MYDLETRLACANRALASASSRLFKESVVLGSSPSFGNVLFRSFTVGVQPGTDRLQSCPAKTTCVSSTRIEEKGKDVQPFVYFDQKGDAVGKLLEAVYTSSQAESRRERERERERVHSLRRKRAPKPPHSADVNLLAARGNFFNGAGVYVLLELLDSSGPRATRERRRPTTVHRIEGFHVKVVESG